MSSQALTCDEKGCHLPAQYFYITIPSLSEIESVLAVVKQLRFDMSAQEAGKPRLSKYCNIHFRECHAVIIKHPSIQKLSRKEYLAYSSVEELMDI